MTEINIALFALFLLREIQGVGYILQELKHSMCHIFKFNCLFHHIILLALI